MKKAKDWIQELKMAPHPEGGYYREMLKAKEEVQGGGFSRPLYTSIYFLLEERNGSNFHQLSSDEVWYFHLGSPLTIHMIHRDGDFEEVTLGENLEEGMRLQYCVPGESIFAASVQEGFALVSCMVAPGFDFRDFKLWGRKELLEKYPDHREIIEKSTREEEN